eukprot:188169_1
MAFKATSILKLSKQSIQTLSKHLPKQYANVNTQRPRSYWEYENIEIDWNLPYDYEVKQKIGRGKYSDVFEGLNTKNNCKCCIKMLKPVKKKKINREIKILQNLSGGTNIIQLYDTIRDPISNTPSLVFEYIECTDWKLLHETLTEHEWRYYFYQLLLAIEYCHCNGIMHRDIKPHNVIINKDTKSVKLIDFGLAEFYHPNKEYNVRVASRYYKAPELLTQNKLYDYSLDLWSFGCMLSGVVFQKEPFFKGIDNSDQLVKIAKVLGTDLLFEYLKKYNCKLDPSIDISLGRTATKPWNKFINDSNKKYSYNSDAIDLIDQCLQYDPRQRITAHEALQHDYFKGIYS